MKTKILAVAPYEGLVKVIDRVSSKRDDIEITTRVGNLEEAVQIMNSMDLKQFDVVVSRGGTFELIKENFQIPLIDIPISDSDIVSAVKSVCLYSQNFAIISFSSITNRARVILELMGISADIFTIQEIDELRPLLNTIDLSKYDTIIGDVITTSCVQEVGMSSIIFASGEESVLSALDQAVYLNEALKEQSFQLNVQNVILQSCDLSFAVFSESGDRVYSDLKEDISEDFLRGLERYVENVLLSGRINIILKSDDLKKNRNISVVGKAVSFDSMRFAVFYINPNVALSDGDEMWISMHTRKEHYAPVFGILNSKNDEMMAVSRRVHALARKDSPVWIEGETGTGKDSIVKSMHAQSAAKNDTLIMINTAFATPRRWTRLFNNINSPLYQMGYYVYFKNVQSMSEESQLQLVEYLMHSRLHQRNRLLFSWEFAHGARESAKSPLFRYLMDELDGSHIVMPALKNRLEDIPSLTYIFINEMNLKYGKRVIGLTAEAMNALEDFDWPHNLNDLKQLLKEAVLVTDSPYITDETIQSLRNQIFTQSGEHQISHVPTGTLHDITKEIIRRVLEEEGNNQLRAAQRLGISRGTLWRRLKEMEEK